jgi:hypothetical protein
MSDDLLTQLRSRGGTTTTAAADESLVMADLTRGRRAVRRTHYRRAVGALGVLTVGGVFATAALNSTPRDVPQANPSPAISTPATSGVRLVAYTGAQPEGFHLTTVPEGFRVIGSTSDALVLAGAGDSGAHPEEYTDRVTISLASKDAATSHTGTAVTVGQHHGVIWQTSDNDGTRVLSYTDAQGHPVDVQVWNTIKLSDAQLVEMASGITVTDQAVQGVG